MGVFDQVLGGRFAGPDMPAGFGDDGSQLRDMSMMPQVGSGYQYAMAGLGAASSLYGALAQGAAANGYSTAPPTWAGAR